jgi:hypothetical protein
VVDGHAYTILHVVDNAGGSVFDLIQVRNPWGKGELTSGKWDDDGPGWDQHPEVRNAISELIGAQAPVQANDGAFWLEKEEFCKYFPTIFLCALNMADFCNKSPACLPVLPILEQCSRTRTRSREDGKAGIRRQLSSSVFVQD